MQNWPDEAGPGVGVDDIGEVEDAIMALFERIAAARNAQLPSRLELLGEIEPGDDAGKRLFALASRVPMGQADRYAVLAAPGAVQRLAALREAVETVSAMVAFQLGAE